MRRTLYQSRVPVGSWDVVICWDVLRLAYRYWTKGRHLGTVLWGPRLAIRYDVNIDDSRRMSLLGPIRIEEMR